MKKLLSALLALALALSLAVCAFAEKAPSEEPRKSPPTYQDMMDKLAPAGPVTQSLNFELPTVTGIIAVWDGDTDALFDRWYGPYFSPENVAVTVSFAEGEPETLTSWYGYYGGDTYWSWHIDYDYDEATGEVTFYYYDSNLWQAYYDSLDNPDEDYDWGVFRATLPQSAFSIPTNPRDEYLNSLPKTVLKLGESQRAPAQEYTLYMFTPAKDGLYYFYSANYRNCDPWAELYDADFNRIVFNHDLFDWNFGIIEELQAGQTYYLFVGGYYEYPEDTDRFDVGVRDDVRRLTSGEIFIELLTGGLFRWHFYDDYAVPGEGSGLDIFRANLEIIRSNVRYNSIQPLINFFYRIIDWLYSIR